MKRVLPLLFAALAGAGSVHAAAYRCEANGAVSYSDTPCPGGRAVSVPGGDTESAAAHGRLAADRKQLAALEKERHRREAQEERAQQATAKRNAARAKKCGTLERRKRWAEEDAAAAAGKSADKARRKARRAVEAYEAECSA